MFQSPEAEACLNDSDEEVLPFTLRELTRLLRQPHRLVQMLLTQRERLGATVAREHRLPLLAVGLLLGSALFALPFGAVLGPERFWRVAALLLGPVAVCLPALHIFGAFVGARLGVLQNLCLSLVVTAVAALFTCAFSPILWFLDLTMMGSTQVTAHDIAILLAVCSLAAGVLQLGRLLHGVPALRRLGTPAMMVLLGWQTLLLLITHRMACFLELL